MRIIIYFGLMLVIVGALFASAMVHAIAGHWVTAFLLWVTCLTVIVMACKIIENN